MLYDKRWTKTAPQIKPVPIEPWRQLLLKAASVLKREGWCRGSAHDGQHFCAVGALMRADGWVPGTPHRYVQSNAFVEAHRHLRRYFDNRSIEAWNDRRVRTGAEVIATISIEAWNDQRGRTGAEVIATMRKVAGA